MPQTVEMMIELRGSGNNKHLHLKKTSPPPRVTLTPPVPGDLQVLWKVSVDATASQIGLAAVTLWFPHVSPLFIQSSAIPIPLREVTILAGGSATLTLNPNFDRTGAGTGDFVMPMAIYCTVDGGQNSANPGHGLEQRGRQMIDGHHSHPECNVGP